MSKKASNPRTKVTVYSDDLSIHDLVGDIDTVVAYLESLRASINQKYPECDRVWIEYDGRYSCMSCGCSDLLRIYAERPETDEEYEKRLHKLCEADKKAKKSQQEHDLKEFEKVKKRYEKLAKKVAKFNKEVKDESKNNS